MIFKSKYKLFYYVNIVYNKKAPKSTAIIRNMVFDHCFYSFINITILWAIYECDNPESHSCVSLFFIYIFFLCSIIVTPKIISRLFQVITSSLNQYMSLNLLLCLYYRKETVWNCQRTSSSFLKNLAVTAIIKKHTGACAGHQPGGWWPNIIFQEVLLQLHYIKTEIFSEWHRFGIKLAKMGRIWFEG